MLPYQHLQLVMQKHHSVDLYAVYQFTSNFWIVMSHTDLLLLLTCTNSILTVYVAADFP